MRTQYLGRKELSRPTLDFETLQSIGAIRRPDTVGAGEDAKVGASAPGGAAFDLKRGMGGAQPVHQGINGTGLLRSGGTAIAPAGMGEVAVHVPFDIGDVVRAQHRVHAVEKISRDLGARQIEHQLVAREQQGPALDPQHPLGVGAVEG